MVTLAAVEELRVGTAQPFGPRGEPSAMGKAPVGAAVWLSETGLAADEQGDRKRHGGAEKALHQYPAEHYALWRGDLPDLGEALVPGAVGENVVARGMTEHDVCIGDILGIGEAVVQVSQGRQPCWKLNVRFGRRDMARRFQDTGRTGWYYRVLDPGWIGPGDAIVRRDRPNPAWPLSRLQRVLYHRTLDRADLGEIAELPALSESWRALARKRLAHGTVEDWSARLTTP